MRKAALVLTTAGALILTGIAAPRSAEAAWRGRFGPAFAGGFVAGAVIGGLAAPAYAWGPPAYGYYGPVYYAPDYYSRNCPQPGYGEYYNCGAYAVPGYGGYYRPW